MCVTIGAPNIFIEVAYDLMKNYETLIPEFVDEYFFGEIYDIHTYIFLDVLTKKKGKDKIAGQ